ELRVVEQRPEFRLDVRAFEAGLPEVRELRRDWRYRALLVRANRAGAQRGHRGSYEHSNRKFTHSPGLPPSLARRSVWSAARMRASLQTASRWSRRTRVSGTIRTWSRPTCRQTPRRPLHAASRRRRLSRAPAAARP